MTAAELRKLMKSVEAQVEKSFFGVQNNTDPEERELAYALWFEGTAQLNRIRNKMTPKIISSNS